MSKTPKRKNRRFHDPWKFYRDNYDELSRSNLKIIDESLYNRLKKDGLLERIPLLEREDYGDNPWEFYMENYSHMSRSELSRKRSGLYVRLRKEGLLERIPILPKGRRSRYGENPLEFYESHYPSMTRGKLFEIDNGLYVALRSKGLLEHVPLMRN